MSLISIAIFDQEGSGRTALTKRTLDSLLKTVDFNDHRLFLIDNGSCDDTKQVIAKFGGNFSPVGTYPIERLTVITLDENVGTAKAVNMGFKYRVPGEHCIKMDNDVEIKFTNWVEELEFAIKADPKIGIVGLKRKDLGESPVSEDFHYRTTLRMLPHQSGERWMVFEQVKAGVFGTCTMFNSALMDKIGYLHQPTIYGWDDGLMSTRSTLAGFINGFLPHIELDHIDPGGTEYTEWKAKHASETSMLALRLEEDYRSGKRPIYEDA